jgi:hypothetical protein
MTLESPAVLAEGSNASRRRKRPPARPRFPPGNRTGPVREGGPGSGSDRWTAPTRPGLVGCRPPTP